MVICDTNIIIELFKNNERVKTMCLQVGENNLCISAITTAELYFGAFDKTEMSKIKGYIFNFPVLHFNDDISQIFLDLMFRYSLNHRPFIGDMIIAATAIYYNIPLLTLNIKDFRFIDELHLYVSR